MKINTLSVIKGFCGILVLGILAVSCKQDPIFYTISTETAPIPALIKGAPTNMVVFEREYPGRTDPVPLLYVASGRLHWYARAAQDLENNEADPQWDLDEYSIPQPEGKIISLAVTGERLYALCLNNSNLNSTLFYIGHSDNVWKQIPGENNYPLIQSIYTDPAAERLFAGVRKDINKNNVITYAILHLDNTDDTLKLLKDETALLSGAGYQDGAFYLCTKGSGIFKVTETDDIIPLPFEDNKLMFMGMIKLKDNMIIVVERNGGALYQIQGGSFEPMRNDSGGDIVSGKYATGALALWEDSSHGMLIAGIQGGLYSTTTSSYIHGYVEFDLTYPGGSFDKNSPRHDSGKLLSVEKNDRYKTSLGKRLINHLFQTPKEIDPKMTFFASTQTAGLWSYKYRPNNGGWQWNAERNE